MPMSETYWTIAQVCEYSYHVRCQLSFQSQFTKENSILSLKKKLQHYSGKDSNPRLCHFEVYI